MDKFIEATIELDKAYSIIKTALKKELELGRDLKIELALSKVLACITETIIELPAMDYEAAKRIG
jgi:uncharacterized phage-associated protein